MKKLLGALVHPFRSIVAIARDPVLYELDVPTANGRGFLFTQIRLGKDGTKYVVVKSKGGDATV